MSKYRSKHNSYGNPLNDSPTPPLHNYQQWFQAPSPLISPLSPLTDDLELGTGMNGSPNCTKLKSGYFQRSILNSDSSIQVKFGLYLLVIISIMTLLCIVGIDMWKSKLYLNELDITRKSQYLKYRPGTRYFLGFGIMWMHGLRLGGGDDNSHVFDTLIRLISLGSFVFNHLQVRLLMLGLLGGYPSFGRLIVFEFIAGFVSFGIWYGIHVILSNRKLITGQNITGARNLLEYETDTFVPFHELVKLSAIGMSGIEVLKYVVVSRANYFNLYYYARQDGSGFLYPYSYVIAPLIELHVLSMGLLGLIITGYSFGCWKFGADYSIRNFRNVDVAMAVMSFVCVSLIHALLQVSNFNDIGEEVSLISYF